MPTSNATKEYGVLPNQEEQLVPAQVGDHHIAQENTQRGLSELAMPLGSL